MEENKKAKRPLKKDNPVAYAAWKKEQEAQKDALSFMNGVFAGFDPQLKAQLAKENQKDKDKAQSKSDKKQGRQDQKSKDKDKAKSTIAEKKAKIREPFLSKIKEVQGKLIQAIMDKKGKADDIKQLQLDIKQQKKLMREAIWKVFPKKAKAVPAE